MEIKKMLTKKLQAIETKKRIYESALELFEEVGFERMSVDSIVEKAGVAKGTFYVHFESKVSLIAEYVNTLDLDYENHLSSLPTGTKQSTKLLLTTEKIIDTIINRIGYDVMKIVYEAYLTKSFDSDSLLNYNRKIYQIFKGIIQLGVNQGEFKAGLNIDLVTNHCVMSIRGTIYEWCIRFPDFDLKEEILQHLGLLLTGIEK